jgi:tetratricopeptide (TPR) repeat protein
VTLARVAFVALLLASAFAALPSRAVAEEEAATKAKAAIYAAAEKRDARALAVALDDANKLVGEVFPDGGDLADWLGTLPESVARLVPVKVRRGWLYVVAKRGADAKAPLESVLGVEPNNGEARAYLGEARRQTGDLEGATADLLRALETGASDALVLPSARRIVIALHEKPPPSDGQGLPAYANAAGRFLARRRMDDVDRGVADWLDFDAHAARSLPKRAALLRAEAVRRAWSWVEGGDAAEAHARARKAVDVAEWVAALGAERPRDLPARFDLLAAAVRLGETGEGDRHEVPEALAGLAEEALARGRYLLAAHLARRRLSMGDSPAARRVLLACPPDVGD